MSFIEKEKKKLFPAIDIARAFLSIFVLFSHTLLSPPWGKFHFLGSYSVMYFFSISAFLLSFLANKEILSKGFFNVKKFYYRRVLRIWPSYFLFILIIVCFLLYKKEILFHLDELLFSMFFIANLKSSLYPFFINQNASSYFIVLWSLGIEEQFYLFFPFFISMVILNKRFKNVLILIGLLVLCSLIRYYFIKQGITKHLSPGPGILYQTTSYLDIIFMSILVGIYRNPILNFLESKKIATNKTALLFLSLLLSIWFLITKVYHFKNPDAYQIKYIIWFPVTGIIGALTVFTLSIIRVADNFFLNTLQHLGKLSYGIYLFHLPIYFILLETKFFVRGNFINFPIVLTLTIIFSHLVYTYYEKHFRFISKKRFS